MKVKRSVMLKLVKEELAKHIQSLLEADPKKPKDSEVVDAEKEKGEKEKNDKKDPKEQKPDDKPPKKDAPKPETKKTPPKELPAEEEPADKAIEKDVAEPDGEEDASEITGGKIADEIVGKTIQSITMTPKSTTAPGFQEISLTFREIPDPLKILVGKTGMTKFVFRGVHNTLGEASDVPSPSQKLRAQHPAGPAKPGEVIKKTSKPNTISLTNDEWKEWQTSPPQVLRVVSAIDGKPLATLNGDQVRRAVSKARYMQGMAKGISSDVGWWLAPIR